MKYSDYQLLFECASCLSKTSAKDLQKRVNEYLRRGYILAEGLTFVLPSHLFGFAQAVALPAEPSRDPMDDPMF